MKKGKPQNGKKHTLGSAEIFFCNNDMELLPGWFPPIETERADAINNFQNARNFLKMAPFPNFGYSPLYLTDYSRLRIKSKVPGQ